MKVVLKATCLANDGLYGVEQRRKGWIASSALYRVDGIAKGPDARKGARIDGVEAWSELNKC